MNGSPMTVMWESGCLKRLFLVEMRLLVPGTAGGRKGQLILIGLSALTPPSIVMTLPVMNRASSLNR